MEQLDLLWNLETHHNSLNENQKELLNLKKSLSINDYEELIIQTEKQLNVFKDKQDDIKRKLIDLNRLLKNYNFKIEEVEKSLYDGTTSNPTQLEYLSQEKNKLKEIIDKTENDIIDFMDEVENMDKELVIINTTVKEIKEKNIILKEKCKSLGDQLNIKIETELEEIRILEEIIDINLLDQYNTLRKNRGSGIAEVKSSACTGCNIKLPTFMMDKLNKDNEILYCESCGRILCKH